MQTDHANAIKGLSIAVIVFSALAIAGGLLGSIVLAAALPYVETASSSLVQDSGYYTYTEEAIVAQLMMGVGGTMLIWAMICHVVVLIAGIFSLRNRSNAQKLGVVFGWSIAGAVISFLGGNLLTCVLLIIIAVFANKDKQMAAAAAAPVAPAQPAQPTAAVPVQPAQPIATAPVQPAPTATQPAAQPIEGSAQQQ